MAKRKQPDLPPQPAPVLAEPIEQPLLFDDFDAGSELLRIEQDARSGKHTGTTLARRIAVREEIGERLCAGVSIRQVCRQYGVGRNTVSRLVLLLEAGGKMEPLKKRLAAKLGQVGELSAELLLERLMSGEIATNVLPIAMGVALDKKADLDAKADLDVTEPERDLNVAALNDWVDRLTKLPDLESSATHANPA